MRERSGSICAGNFPPFQLLRKIFKQMKRVLLKRGYLLVLFCFFVGTQLSAQLNTKIIGLWACGDGDDSEVQFKQDTKGLWKGTIVNTKVARSVGKLLFKDGVYDESSNEIRGVLIHPDSGWEVTGILSLDSARKLRVVAKKFFVKKTFYWTRV